MVCPPLRALRHARSLHVSLRRLSGSVIFLRKRSHRWNSSWHPRSTRRRPQIRKANRDVRLLMLVIRLGACRSAAPARYPPSHFLAFLTLNTRFTTRLAHIIRLLCEIQCSADVRCRCALHNMYSNIRCCIWCICTKYDEAAHTHTHTQMHTYTPHHACRTPYTDRIGSMAESGKRLDNGRSSSDTS